LHSSSGKAANHSTRSAALNISSRLAVKLQDSCRFVWVANPRHSHIVGEPNAGNSRGGPSRPTMTDDLQNRNRSEGIPSRQLNILLATLTGPVSSTAFYEKALRKRHRVVTFGPHRDGKFWQDWGEGLKGHAFYRAGSAEHWEDVCGRLARPCDIVTPPGMVDLRELKKKLHGNFRPDLFIWMDTHEWNLPFYMEALNCPSVAVFGDTHLHMLGDWDVWLSYAKLFDFVFVTFNKPHLQLFVEAGCRRVFWSPAACDPEAHGKIPSDKIYPVSFVGGTSTLHTDRVKLLRFLLQQGIDLHIDSRVLQDMALIFSRSKIVLNTTIADDVNMRVFEALASGSLVLTNRLSRESGLEELFVDRKHLVLYDPDNVLDLIRYYLDHAEEREQVAATGYDEALSKHTYEHRVEQILETVRQRL
jgi:hypothetical protein